MSTRLLLAACAVFCATTAPIAAQSFTFNDFSSVTDLSLNGSSAQIANRVRLTANASNQNGALWHDVPQLVVAGFDTQFQFRISPPPGGVLAEGMSFIIQNAINGSSTLGGSVWGLGYGPGANGAAIANSLAIEMDTFQDGFLSDTSSNELSVHTNGMLNNNANEGFSIGRTTPPFSLSNSQVHTMRVRYQPGTLEVFIDNLIVPQLTLPYDLLAGGNFANSGAPVGGLNLPDGTAFVGFGATTGAGNLQEQVEILSWTFTSTPATEPCFAGTVGATSGGPFDVLKINGDAGGFFRRVQVDTFEHFTIDVDQPTTNLQSAPYLIFGTVGAATGTQTTALPIGDLCFPLTFPQLPPATFVLLNTFGPLPAPLAPSTLTPFSILVAGIPITVDLTFQGVIAETTSPLTLAITNGLVLEVAPGQAPAINSVTPLSAAAGGNITIAGSEFTNGLTLSINGTTVTPTSVTPTSIDFAYPAGLACDSTLTVTNPDGQSVGSALNPTPVINNSFSSQGPAAGGTNFIMIGFGFAAGTTVTIGGNPATVNQVSNGVLIVSTPPGTVGPANVVVTTPGGCVVMTTFTYL